MPGRLPTLPACAGVCEPVQPGRALLRAAAVLVAAPGHGPGPQRTVRAQGGARCWPRTRFPHRQSLRTRCLAGACMAPAAQTQAVGWPLRLGLPQQLCGLQLSLVRRWPASCAACADTWAAAEGRLLSDCAETGLGYRWDGAALGTLQGHQPSQGHRRAARRGRPVHSCAPVPLFWEACSILLALDTAISPGQWLLHTAMWLRQAPAQLLWGQRRLGPQV